MHSNENVIKK